MSSRPNHPDQVLYGGEAIFPVLPPIEHYAGSEKLILKALDIQNKKGPVFDITLDLEDGAPAGKEIEHAELCANIISGNQNQFHRLGVRIHDYSSPWWKRDLEIVLPAAYEKLAYITIPKASCVNDVISILDSVEQIQQQHRIRREIPVHVLIEGHGALRDIDSIASLKHVEVIDFGLMDFVSAHNGAIPTSALRSPGQFEHNLVRRAKEEIAAGALRNGCVPSHNVTVDYKNYEQTRDDARRARREFGFLRMWSIHPTQIDAILEGMAVEHSEVELAIAILKKARDNDWGPISHENHLHDRASFRIYWTLLKQAHASGTQLPEAIKQEWFGG